MKIPFLPYVIISTKRIEGYKQCQTIATHQVAQFLSENHTMREFIGRLPAKHKPKARIKAG